MNELHGAPQVESFEDVLIEHLYVMSMVKRALLRVALDVIHMDPGHAVDLLKSIRELTHSADVLMDNFSGLSQTED